MAINKNDIDYSLYLVTDQEILQGRDLIPCVEEALMGGVTMVQLREKHLSSRDFYELAVKLKELCRQYHLPLIINDRLDIMLAVDADGLHIGQEDMPVNIARKLIGTDKILGYSVASVKDALYGAAFADYLGAGPVFPTSSKQDTCDPIGIMEMQAIKQAVHLPVVSIGGINRMNLKEVQASGADGIAVISAVLGQENIIAASQDLLQQWRSNPPATRYAGSFYSPKHY